MRNAALLLFTIALVACSSSSTPNAHIIQPEIDLLQVVGPAELNYPNGGADLRFDVEIANRSGEPITLKRVELSTMNGGAYVLRREFRNYDVTIAPGRGASVTVWAKALIRGGTIREQEPVRIRGVLNFDSPVGPFHSIVMREFRQYPGANDPR